MTPGGCNPQYFARDVAILPFALGALPGLPFATSGARAAVRRGTSRPTLGAGRVITYRYWPAARV